MGGKFYRNAPHKNSVLAVPRLTPAQYAAFSPTVVSALHNLFHDVSLPPEPPGKPSFGDVDVIVSRPRPWAREPRLLALAVRDGLGGLDAAYDEDARVLHVAIPFNDELRALASDGTQGDTGSDDRTGRPRILCVQIDVLISPAWLFAWNAWTSAHGDMAEILARMHEHLSLRFEHKGLYLRIEPPADAPPGIAIQKIHLTASPEATLRFLRLKPSAMASFASRDDIYAWLVSGAYYDPAVLAAPTSRDATLRHKGRAMYTAFMDTWAPAHAATHAAPAEQDRTTRDRVLADAAAHFPGARAAIASAHAAYASATREAALQARINAALASSPPSISGAKANMKMLREWVAFDAAGAPVLRAEPLVSDGAWSALSRVPDDELADFVARKAAEVGLRSRAWARGARESAAVACVAPACLEDAGLGLGESLGLWGGGGVVEQSG